MEIYAVLLRGINVGGKNTIPMKDLKVLLEKEGFENVRTLLNSGNAVLQSKLDTKTIAQKIETALTKTFKLDSSLIRVLVLSHKQLQEIARNKPKGFGDYPSKYYSDVIFLIGISGDEAFKVFNPREGVDTLWQGDSIIYSQRVTAERTRSRLGKIVGTRPYQHMTIRSWNTVVKLLKVLEDVKSK